MVLKPFLIEACDSDEDAGFEGPLVDSANCSAAYSVFVGLPDRSVFDLRNPGVHQSGSGPCQHQRGGRWTLPRHE